MYTLLWEPEDGRYSKELRGTILRLRILITIGTRMLGYRDSPPSVSWLDVLSFLAPALENVGTIRSSREFTAVSFGAL